MASSKNVDGSSNNCKSKCSVVVYTSEGCPRCAILKEWLKTSGIEFEERSLENTDVMAELVMRNVVVLSAPALEVGEIVFTQDQIFVEGSLAGDKLLAILGGKANG